MVIWQSFKNWWSDDPLTQSAAAAFFAVLSLPGLLILLLGIASLFMESARVETTVFNHVEAMIGADTARNMNQIVDHTQQEDRDTIAFLVGLSTLLFGATGLFIHLQKSLNNIWDVTTYTPPRYRFKAIKNRLVSMGLILIIGFLMTISMALTALITLLSEYLSQFMPDVVLFMVHAINFVIALITTVILFTLIYKVLPDHTVNFKSALHGGMFAACVFKIGEYGLNFYFEAAKPHTAYGAAGSIILLMLWVFFTCMIIFIGAEMTKVLQNKNSHTA